MAACSVSRGSSKPGRIEDDHLRVVGGADADDAMAGGLRLGRGDGELFADEPIEQRGFAGVGESGDGDDAGLGHADAIGTGIGVRAPREARANGDEQNDEAPATE